MYQWYHITFVFLLTSLSRIFSRSIHVATNENILYFLRMSISWCVCVCMYLCVYIHTYLHSYICCVLSHFSRVQLFVTLWTIACQAPPSMGFPRKEHWSGLPFPSPGVIPDPGFEPRSPVLQGSSLPFELPGNPTWVELKHTHTHTHTHPVRLYSYRTKNKYNYTLRIRTVGRQKECTVPTELRVL